MAEDEEEKVLGQERQEGANLVTLSCTFIYTIFLFDALYTSFATLRSVFQNKTSIS